MAAFHAGVHRSLGQPQLTLLSSRSAMPFPLVQCDAFTDTPFAGNPVAVCVTPEPQPESWMQQVAAEMNLSETAFIVPRADPVADGWDLRWFTPTVEVDLCGHATLGSAHVLWSQGHLAPDAAARFHTKSGVLTCARDPGPGGWICMDFPASSLTTCDTPPPELLPGLRLSEAVSVTRTDFDLLVEVDDPQVLRQMVPDLATLGKIATRGIIVTCLAEPGKGCDFLSRFFGPAAGIPEDPVTGSAHCALAPYWHRRLGKAEMVGYQASKRGGVVRVRHTGDRVELAGQAVTVLRGELV